MIAQVMSAANLSQQWKKAAVTNDDVPAEKLADLALKDVCLRTNPAKMEAKDLVGIIEETA